MSRFRSGTLERSVKRWGRMPSFNKFKRKQQAWQYVESSEVNLPVAGNTSEVVIFDAADWSSASGAGENCRNFRARLRVGVMWSPESTALAFDSWYVKAGVFVCDDDEVLANIDAYFGEKRARWWGCHFNNSTEQPAAIGVGGQERHREWTINIRQNFLKLDEELRFIIAFNGNVTSTIADARYSIFGVEWWETP